MLPGAAERYAVEAAGAPGAPPPVPPQGPTEARRGDRGQPTPPASPVQGAPRGPDHHQTHDRCGAPSPPSAAACTRRRGRPSAPPSASAGPRAAASAPVDAATTTRAAAAGAAALSFAGVVRLAAAHLDHDPTNNTLSNLAAWCNRCHIRHDRHFQAASRRRRRQRLERRPLRLPLALPGPPVLAGVQLQLGLVGAELVADHAKPPWSADLSAARPVVARKTAPRTALSGAQRPTSSA